ncbi:hypothetical protein Hanom_Chr12g01127631 [Helianthus anomalus]
MHGHALNRTAMHQTARPCTKPHDRAVPTTLGGHWQCTSQCTGFLEIARPCGQAHDHATKRTTMRPSAWPCTISLQIHFDVRKR